MVEPSWRSAEEELFRTTVRALERFTDEHPNEHCSFLAFDSDPGAGYVLVALDTPEHALRAARAEYDQVVFAREQALGRANPWQTARYYAARPVHLYAPNTGEFAYPDFAEASFPEWRSFDEDEAPETESWQGDYLEGNVIVVFERVAAKLLTADALRRLRRTEPFRIGFNFHDGVLCVLRIEGWPGSSEPCQEPPT